MARSKKGPKLPIGTWTNNISKHIKTFNTERLVKCHIDINAKSKCIRDNSRINPILLKVDPLKAVSIQHIVDMVIDALVCHPVLNMLCGIQALDKSNNITYLEPVLKSRPHKPDSIPEIEMLLTSKEVMINHFDTDIDLCQDSDVLEHNDVPMLIAGMLAHQLINMLLSIIVTRGDASFKVDPLNFRSINSELAQFYGAYPHIARMIINGDTCRTNFLIDYLFVVSNCIYARSFRSAATFCMVPKSYEQAMDLSSRFRVSDKIELSDYIRGYLGGAGKLALISSAPIDNVVMGAVGSCTDAGIILAIKAVGVSPYTNKFFIDGSFVIIDSNHYATFQIET